MNLKSKTLTAVAATVIVGGGLSVVAASPAFAISRAYPCTAGDSSNFLEFYNNESTCWANAGSVSVELYGVTDVYSGNNAGYFQDSSGNIYDFAKYAHIPSGSDWQPGKTVTYIDIYP